MGKKKTTTGGRVISISLPGAERERARAEEEEELVIPADDDPEADALETLAALGGEGETKFVVSCLAPLDRRGKLDEVSREDVPELWQYLRDKYGPGKYAVHAITNGRYVKGSRRIIEISPLAKAPGAAGALVPVAGAAAGASELDRWRAEERERQAAERERAREDRKFMLGLLVPALPGLLQLFRPPTLADQAAAMQALGVGGAARGGFSEDKIIDVLMKGMELAEKSKEGNTDSWPGLIRETLRDLAGSPLGQAVVDKLGTRAPKPAAALTHNPAAPAPAAAPAAAAAPAQGADMIQPLLRKLAAELQEFAANGADPGLAAEALVAKVPRPVWAMVNGHQLHGWLTDAAWWSHVVAFAPALQPYQAFCDDARQALYLYLVEKGAIPPGLDGAPAEEAAP